MSYESEIIIWIPMLMIFCPFAREIKIKGAIVKIELEMYFVGISNHIIKKDIQKMYFKRNSSYQVGQDGRTQQL